MSIEDSLVELLRRKGFRVAPDEALYESLGGGRVRHRRIVATSERAKIVWSVAEDLNLYELRITLWGSLSEQVEERLSSLGAVIDDADQNTRRILLRGALEEADIAVNALSMLLRLD